jgi:hypothetical protein
VRLVTTIEDSVRDTAGDEVFRAACDTAAALGCATFTAECMDFESRKMSPVTRRVVCLVCVCSACVHELFPRVRTTPDLLPLRSSFSGGRFDKCVETCNIGPVISGVPPSPALKVTLF